MTDTDTLSIAKRREAVLAELSDAATPAPQLVAVTKTQPDAAIDEILATGQRGKPSGVFTLASCRRPKPAGAAAGPLIRTSNCT